VTRLLAIIVVLLTSSLALVACGSNKESQAEAKDHLCSSLDAFAASVVSLQGLSLQSASEDDLKSSVNKVNDAWDQVVEDAKDVKDVSTDKIRSAYDDLKDAIENRPTDKPVTQVVSDLGPKLTAFAQAWKDFASSVNCKTS
jgi:Zn-dependent M32 family carboxypeptidase